MRRTFKKEIFLVMLFAALFLATPIYAKVTVLRTINLGSLGAGYTLAVDINNNGMVIGMSDTKTDIWSHCFVLVPKDTDGDGKPDTWYQDINNDGINDLMIDLGGNLVPQKINDLGQIVGYKINVSGYDRAFVILPKDTDGDGKPDTWYQDVNNDGINDLMFYLTLGGKWSWAWGINNIGQVVGSGTISSDDYYTHAFLWSVESGIMDIGKSSPGYRINDLGQVVAGRLLIKPEDVNQDGKPVIWYRDSNGDGINDLLIDLGSSEWQPIFSSGINNLGQVTGKGVRCGYFGHHAFIIIPEDTDSDGKPDTWYRDSDDNGINDLMRDLGTLGGFDSDALGINNHGNVVGFAETYEGYHHAFIWTPEDGMVAIGTNTWAFGINDHEQIVGGNTLWIVKVGRLTQQEEIDLVISRIESFINDNVLRKGEGASLISKLDASKQRYNNDNTIAACNILQAFTNEIDALIKSERLSETNAQALIDPINSMSICQ